MNNYLNLVDESDCILIDENGEYPNVQENDPGIRPAGKPDHCFYCGSKIGEKHKEDCVIVCKPTKLKAILYYEKDTPASWNKEQIEFRYNESCWCASNLHDQISRKLEEDENICLCPYTVIKVVDDISEAEIKFISVDEPPSEPEYEGLTIYILENSGSMMIYCKDQNDYDRKLDELSDRNIDISNIFFFVKTENDNE